MPSHDYAVSIGGVDIKNTIGAQEAIFMNYTTANKRGNNLIIPYRHGELHVPDKYFAGADLLLQVYLPFDTTDAAKQALSDLALILSSQDEVLVAQNDPAHGDIQARIELLQDPVPTEDRFTYLFSLRNASGFWEDVSATPITSANPPVVTTGGDRPIQDMILVFAGVGFLQHTDSLGQVSRVEVEAGATGGPFTLDVGARTIENASNVPMDEFFLHTQPWVMKWQPGVAQSFTANVAVGGSYRNKYA